jgi:NAD(P) transhydrogenase
LNRELENMPAKNYDLVVIGAGPGGAWGARTAASFGKRVALVEKTGMIGGADINTGTIPSKTLRETALALSGWRSRRLFGVDLSLRRKATIGDFMFHEKNVTAHERQRIENLLRENGVEIFHGTGSLIDPHTVGVTGPTGASLSLKGDKILVATGSSPVHPPDFPFHDKRVCDSNQILELKALPKRLAVIGAGVIGSEYACTFAALGVDVHLIDARRELLPFLDREISAALGAAMSSNGVVFHWGERVLVCDVSRSEAVALAFASGTRLEVDTVLVAAGRNSNTDGLNLSAVGLKPGKRGRLPVDINYQTKVPNIYAVGDVIGPPALAATSLAQGRVAMCHAFDVSFGAGIAPLLPTGIYTIPEVSMVGETEESLVANGIQFLVGRASYLETPRGEIVGERIGFLKLLFRRQDMRLLGVHVIGEHATELAHLGLLAMLMRAGSELFDGACFNLPTLGDLYRIATYKALLARHRGR